MSRRSLLVLVLLLVAGVSWGATGPGPGWVGNWSPGIGDPTLVGWITVFAYLAAAGLCFASVALVGRARQSRVARWKETALWWILGLLMAFLGINKQLDLQTAFTEFMRMVAFDEGWYERRRFYQEWFILFLGLWVAIALGGLLYLTHKVSPWARTAAVGCGLVAGYVVARAASFHNFDQIIQHEILFLRVNWILELGGIAVVVLGAGARFRQLRRG